MTQVRPTAEVLRVVPEDLQRAFGLGWRDFLRAPLAGMGFAVVYVMAGWLITFALTTSGQIWWTLPAAAGFPILGPFIACGFYEISRCLEQGRALTASGVLGVIFRQKDRQIPSIAAIMVVFFLFWNFLAHMIFALFLGTSSMTNVSSSFQIFLTAQGFAMLATGTVVGAGFAGLLFSLMVVSMPMLLDRDVDFVTAMLTSIDVVRASPVVMLAWGAFIAAALFLAMLPGFLGLLIVLPVLGHASWHLYRAAVSWGAA